ncbi:MAG TPA: hypothetical protein VF698_09640 [Thermoanaerobaculia bacterium]
METLEFRNETGRTWTLAIFLTPPGAGGGESVAWKLLRTPPGGISRLMWDDTLCAAIADYETREDGSFFHWQQLLPVKAGQACRVVSDRGVRTLELDGDAASADQLEIRNQTDGPVNAGMGQAESPALYLRGLRPGAAAAFRVTEPRYLIGIYDHFEAGQVASPPAVGPLALNIPPGVTSIRVTLRPEDGGFTSIVEYRA